MAEKDNKTSTSKYAEQRRIYTKIREVEIDGKIFTVINEFPIDSKSTAKDKLRALVKAY
ncbi:MAG: hypothetical protein IKP78_00165 [Ruminococcus sp.]|jgi:hypothetical protein|nr:hypothetical protein [Ruminococcus sp.]MCR4863314.1 hypothetical protein [Ruminococcus sp.]